jgi:hypothetical protein
MPYAPKVEATGNNKKKNRGCFAGSKAVGLCEDDV